MKIYDKIRNIALNKNICCEIWAENENEILVQINWGDWKHDHLALKFAIIEELHPATSTSEVIEEDGSDCFSAIHRFIFKET